MDTTVLYFNTKNSRSSINQQNFQINYQKDYYSSVPCLTHHFGKYFVKNLDLPTNQFE